MDLHCECGRLKRQVRALVCPRCWQATPENLRQAWLVPLDHHARAVCGDKIRALARTRRPMVVSDQPELPSVAPYVNGGAA